jgi:hypothetical protein
VIGCGTPLAAILLFLRGQDTVAGASGLLLGHVAAATVIGAALGFLFGVTRTTTKDPDGSSGSPDHRNSNLGRISDWLTTVLIGATLTQLGRIPTAVAELAVVLGAPLDAGVARPDARRHRLQHG